MQVTSLHSFPHNTNIHNPLFRIHMTQIASRHIFSKYSLGTLFVSQTPFADKKKSYPAFCISPAKTLYKTGLPCLFPTLIAVSMSTDKCTYNLDFASNPCSSMKPSYFTAVPCQNHVPYEFHQLIPLHLPNHVHPV